MEYLPNVVVGILTLVLGFLWYGPKTLEGVWKKAAGLTDEDIQGGNMAVIFGFAFVMAVILSVPIGFLCGFHKPENGDVTFIHGMFHGAQLVGMVGLPVLISNGLFERKGLNYFLINGAYWLIVGAMMGGVLMIWR